jgi:hypothetical protein
MKNKDISTSVFLVAGYTRNKDNLQFLGFDAHSGGYPWASSHIADKTTDILKAVSWLDDARSDYVRMENPKVYEVLLREVDVSAIIDEEQRVEEFLKDMSDSQRKILKRKLK